MVWETRVQSQVESYQKLKKWYLMSLCLTFSIIRYGSRVNGASKERYSTIAERISYFCLARNLIRLLGSTHNFTQSGWLILFNRDHLSGQHKLGKSAKHFPFENCFVRDRCLTVCSSIAVAASHHHEGRCLIYGPLASILLDQGFPVEYELDEFNTPHTGTTLRHPQNWLCQLWCKIPLRCLATSPLGNIFWRHSCFSPKKLEPQTHGDYKGFCPQTANTTFGTLWRTYLPQHIQQCLNLTMHFSLRHLAAKMLSQFYHNFISFPYFFPSYETCSIFHPAIKNLHIKPNGIFLLHHLTPLFTFYP